MTTEQMQALLSVEGARSFLNRELDPLIRAAQREDRYVDLEHMQRTRSAFLILAHEVQRLRKEP